MKKTGRCPKCQHHRLLHVAQVADRGDAGTTSLRHEQGTIDPAVAHAWRIARVYNPDPGFLQPNQAAAGLVEAFICRGCGLTELYTLWVEDIPVDGEHVREINGPEPVGPYR